MKLLVLAGDRCEALLSRAVEDVKVERVEADAIWAHVGMKQKTKNPKGLDAPEVGAAYTFIGMAADSKLVHPWELGKRSIQTTDAFIEKLDAAISSKFQISTDGLSTYLPGLGERPVKDPSRSWRHHQRVRYGGNRGGAAVQPALDNSRREVRGAREARSGADLHQLHRKAELDAPDAEPALAPIDDAFSKKWENLRASLALHFATYTFVRRQSALRMTLAMKAGITKRFWGIEDLLTA